MIETEAEMRTRSQAWADDALTRFAPDRMGLWRHLGWRLFRPSLVEFVAAGFIGGYNAAQDDAAGVKR